MLQNLYYETKLVLTGGFSQIPNPARIETARLQLVAALGGRDENLRKNYLELYYPNYWLTVSAEDRLRHAHFIAEADREKKTLAIMIRPLEFEAVTEITVFAPDHPKLLSIITGACAAANANIVDAQIFTTTDGRALDTILINREFPHDEDERRRATRVSRMIENMLDGEVRLPEIIRTSCTRQKRAAEAFEHTPRVEIKNNFSDTFSVIEVKGLDRPGLLSELTAVLSSLSLNIASAHINTFGEKVIDSFHVTDLGGKKITSLQRQRNIRRKLLALFDSLSR